MPTPLRCDPKLFEKDLTGQIIIVTGANSGIGLETSRQLIKQNATVILACRNESRANVAIDDINTTEDKSRTVFMPLELSDLNSVRSFATMFLEKYDRLDILVANAGVMACPYETTKDGFEFQFGCNHLAHFLLLKLLAPLLTQTAEANKTPSKFISVSSSAAAAMSIGITAMANIDFEDLMFEKRKYDQFIAYQQSKLANYLTAFEASKKYDAEKLLCVSLHPGWVRSNLDKHVLSSGLFGNLMRNIFQKVGKMISAQDGAQTTLHCVLDDVENGAFYSQFGDYREKACTDGGWPMKLPNPNATPENAAKLWEESEKLVGA